jgi:hypothetical protein
MTITRSGIPTTYAYGNMRSRLEARWAAFFDLVGWSWVYEPIDADGYIPDFLVEGEYPFFVEVGPCIVPRDYEGKTAKADSAAASLGHDVLIVGASPLPGLRLNGSGSLAAGWLGEYDGGGLDFGPGYTWDVGVWAWDHGGLAIFHSIMNYTHRPRAGSLREHSLDDRTGYPPRGESGSEMLKRLWAEAGNEVQWHRR